ncbi:hypothetical protein Q5752_000304 [Cryptotrichosporon argae]
MTQGAIAVDADVFADRLSTVSLLEAMYPLPSELVLAPSSLAALALLQSDPSAVPPVPALELVLNLANARGAVPLTCVLPLSSWPISISARQPPFLSRAQQDALVACLPRPGPDSSAETILSAIEAVTSFLADLLPDPLPARPEEQAVDEPEHADEDEERVWFWFPSLSTREKRQDLVDYAPLYGLTGFVLAGKPGLLCLEGRPRAVDRYMAAIKSESWSDIPAHQKKVSERLRVRLGPAAATATSSNAAHGRRFTDMREVTHLVTQHGQYNHRGDMGEVRRLMEAWGVGDDFGAVVMGS